LGEKLRDAHIQIEELERKNEALEEQLVPEAEKIMFPGSKARPVCNAKNYVWKPSAPGYIPTSWTYIELTYTGRNFPLLGFQAQRSAKEFRAPRYTRLLQYKSTNKKIIYIYTRRQKISLPVILGGCILKNWREFRRMWPRTNCGTVVAFAATDSGR
jgi:hypothetical protein